MRLHEQFHIPENWALDAFGRRKLEQALRSAEHRILQRALGQVVNVPTVVDDDSELVETAVHVCEIAALEWWDAARFPDGENAENARKFGQVCGIACTLLQALPLPASPEAKVSHILRVIALGYLADRATDVRRWINELGDEVWVEMEGWNGRLASKILETWVRLVRRKDWDEVSQIAQIIHALRQEQREQEGTYLANQNKEDVAATSWQLISFYHWAKATEVLAEFMLQGTPADAEGIIDIHFEKSFIAAEQSGSFELGNLLRWLQLASHRLIRNAVWNVSKRFNSNITHYVQQLVKSSRTTLELLPPQRKAIFEEGLLDRTHNAIVVSLPTSSGKTQLAIFRILEAINHFGDR
ncbi:MAG: hypothetical protein K6T83_23320, partial [Alicyclobacillus sp.]|nr:hypothetical protein [Alicyclobacillus sp.]